MEVFKSREISFLMSLVIYKQIINECSHFLWAAYAEIFYERNCNVWLQLQQLKNYSSMAAATRYYNQLNRAYIDGRNLSRIWLQTNWGLKSVNHSMLQLLVFIPFEDNKRRTKLVWPNGTYKPRLPTVHRFVLLSLVQELSRMNGHCTLCTLALVFNVKTINSLWNSLAFRTDPNARALRVNSSLYRYFLFLYRASLSCNPRWQSFLIFGRYSNKQAVVGSVGFLHFADACQWKLSMRQSPTKTKADIS